MHVVGEGTRQQILRSENSPALQSAHIKHVGISDAVEPYRIARTQLSGAFLLCTLAGEGRMLLDGKWRHHLPGAISVAPAMTLHAFHAIAGVRWETCWVRFTPEAAISQSNAIVPLLIEADCRPLKSAVEGLQYEASSGQHVASEILWVGLLQHYVARLTSRHNGDPRIYAAFDAVQSDFARQWTLETLAAKANMSPEHFRRLCLRTLGRSPMRQVTALRVQRAAHLLATTAEKFESIAIDMGYRNPFAFSNTFKKITGFRPSVMRQSGGNRDDTVAPNVRG